MRQWHQVIRKFLTAEEVPRWFGLSVVLIYLVGLGTIAQYGIAQARREAAARFQIDSQYAVKLLSERLGASGESRPNDPAWVGRAQRALRDFAANLPARAVRIVAGRSIVASISPAETGTLQSEPIAGEVQPNGPEVLALAPAAGAAGQCLIRAKITTLDRGEPLGSDSPAEPLVLEVVFPLEPVFGSSLVNYARLLCIVLAVLGALFVVYRCLREQLRGVSRIASRLETHRERMEHDISSLRINNSPDGVTSAWNELVDLAERLSLTAQRTDANDELSRVLQRSTGGALAEALNVLPDGMVYVAEDGRIEYVNSTACRLFGWNPQEVRKRSLKEVEAAGVAGRVLEVIREAMLPDGCFEARSELVEPDAPARDDASTYRVLVIPFQRPRQQGECVVLIRDVSQQLRAERAREEFIAQVTHELRTPLTNIRAYTETLSSGMFEDPKVVTECYNVITKETRRLSRLVEDMLSVSQLEVGAIALKLDQVDLRALLSDGVRDVRGLAEEKNIDLQLVLPAKMEPLRADRDKLAVVLNNLLGNAIKYTPANGNVVVGCQYASDAVILTFKDNGIGIDPLEHAKVFEKFQRGSNPQVQHETGTGIGLYTAREIARRHGGEIEVMSERDKGATFVVRLPRQESRAGALSTPAVGAASRG